MELTAGPAAMTAATGNGKINKTNLLRWLPLSRAFPPLTTTNVSVCVCRIAPSARSRPSFTPRRPILALSLPSWRQPCDGSLSSSSVDVHSVQPSLPPPYRNRPSWRFRCLYNSPILSILSFLALFLSLFLSYSLA